MQFKKVLKSLFNPNDGSRRAVSEIVDSAIEKTNVAASNLEKTISDFMTQNDQLTGRLKKNAVKLKKQ